MTWRNSCSISFARVVSESSWYERRMFKKVNAVQMCLKIGAAKSGPSQRFLHKLTVGFLRRQL